MKLIKKNSPNHYNGRAGWKADMICFHQTGGTSVTTALNWYMNPAAQCSPNYVIDANGDVYQLVDPDNGAWANGTSTKTTDKKYYGFALSELVRTRKTNANYYTYSIEFVHCQWGNINESQIASAVDLIRTVIIPHMKSHGIKPVIDRAHLVGHSDITPKTRDPEKFNCPGKRFPYDEIIKRVNGKAASVPSVMTTAATKKCTVAYPATVRAKPTTDSAKLGKYNPGQTVTVVTGTETKDIKSGYTYIRVAGETERWIVVSAVK